MKRLLPVALCLLLNLLQTTAEESSLRKNSPFLPPGYNKQKAVPQPVQQLNGPISKEIEFRGVVQLGGDYQFSLFNKSEQRGYWIRENESENGLGVRDFDPDSMSVTVNLNGRLERLTLMTASDSPLPVTRATAAPTPTETPSLPKPNLQGNGTKPPTEQRRQVIPRRRVVLPRN